MSVQLRRSTSNAKIAGVCSGIAERMQIDPVFVRLIFLAWLVLIAISGMLLYVPLRPIGMIGLIAGILSVVSYLTLWVAMPTTHASLAHDQSDGALVAAQPLALASPSAETAEWASNPGSGERISR